MYSFWNPGPDPNERFPPHLTGIDDKSSSRLRSPWRPVETGRFVLLPDHALFRNRADSRINSVSVRTI